MTPSSTGERAGSSGWPVRHTESFGGVVVRDTDDGLEVALIRTRSLRGDEVWTLPKGAADDGEAGDVAALREVREETGLRAEIVQQLDSKTYWFTWPPEHVRYRKTVHLFLMRATGGDLSSHDDEVEEARFFPISAAIPRVKYRTDKEVLKRVAAIARTW